MEYLKGKFGAIIPKKNTLSCQKFVNEITHSEYFMIFLFFGSYHIFDKKEDLKNQLIEVLEDPENVASYKLIDIIKSDIGDKFFEIESYEEFYGQMCYARTIDNLLTYFKDVLGEVILKQPSILKSQETEKLDFILNFDTMEDLQIALAEKKIEALFYSGISTIENYFKQRLNISLFKSEQDKAEFNGAIKNRNLIVHNRGIINKEYVKEFPEYKPNLGDKIKFSYEQISNINLMLMNFVAQLDYELSKKYNLEQIENF